MAKGVLVVAFDLPEDTDEAYAKLQHIADEVRPSFEGKSDVQVLVGIHEAADRVLAVLAEET